MPSAPTKQPIAASPAAPPATTLPAVNTPTLGPLVTMRELTEIMIRHYGLHQGKFDLMIEFGIGIGAVGPNPSQLNPGAMVSINKIGLQAATVDSPGTVDAAIINPKSPKRKAVAAKK